MSGCRVESVECLLYGVQCREWGMVRRAAYGCREDSLSCRVSLASAVGVLCLGCGDEFAAGEVLTRREDSSSRNRPRVKYQLVYLCIRREDVECEEVAGKTR